MSTAFPMNGNYIPPIPEHHIIRRPTIRIGDTDVRKSTKPKGLKAKPKQREKKRFGMPRH